MDFDFGAAASALITGDLATLKVIFAQLPESEGVPFIWDEGRGEWQIGGGLDWSDLDAVMRPGGAGGYECTPRYLGDPLSGLDAEEVADAIRGMVEIWLEADE